MLLLQSRATHRTDQNYPRFQSKLKLAPPLMFLSARLSVLRCCRNLLLPTRFTVSHPGTRLRYNFLNFVSFRRALFGADVFSVTTKAKTRSGKSFCSSWDEQWRCQSPFSGNCAHDVTLVSVAAAFFARSSLSRQKPSRDVPSRSSMTQSAHSSK